MNEIWITGCRLRVSSVKISQDSKFISGLCKTGDFSQTQKNPDFAKFSS